MLTDRRGRIAKKLRISVTDRCNFACLFCMPKKDKVRWIPRSEVLSFEEIERVTTVLAGMGIENVRVTGGEPLLRRDLPTLIGMLVKVPGVMRVDMTTNGWFLEEKAGELKEAGLRGVTVSLHTLKRDRFAKISGMDALPRVLKGIEAAIDAGLAPVKINSVAIRGYNDDEILDLVNYAREAGVSIRFIEFMPLDGLGIWSQGSLISGREIMEEVSRSERLVPQGRGHGETSSRWKFEDGPGELGLITPMSEPFCGDCDRVRLTSDGQLLSCLFDTKFHDLKGALRSGGSDAELSELIRQAVWNKIDGVGYMPWIKEGWEKPRSMNGIGG